MIKNIVFDLGNVLTYFEPERYVNSHISKEKYKEDILNALFKSVEWIMFDRGTLEEDELLHIVKNKFPKEIHEEIESLVRNWWKEFEPDKEMENLVIRLKEAGYKLYLLSNTSPPFYEFSKLLPAIKYFDKTFISADYKMLKPSTEIYKKFHQVFSLNPKECFFIDDAPMNIEGALQTGMDGYVYNGDVKKLEQVLFNKGIKF